MAKKTAAKKPVTKKPRRRLKRTARRSLAAVLMITAVVVAAIPVPENAAADPDETARIAARAADVHTTAVADNFGYDAKGKEIKDIQAAKWAKANLNEFVKEDANGVASLDEAAIWNSYNKASGNTKKPVDASLTIRNIEGEDTLTWQFLYYDVDITNSGISASGTRQVICMYNGEFTAEGIKIPMVLNTEYYTVADTIISNYFKGLAPNGKALTDTDADSWDTYVDTSPNQKYKYTVDMYINAQKPNSIPSDTMKFFTEYFANDDDLQTLNAKYQQYLNSYDEETGYYDETLIDRNTDFLERRPQDIKNADAQIKFYCAHDVELKLQAEPYTLVAVRDQRPNKSGTVYVAKGGKPSTIKPYYDADGYLVKKQSKNLVCGIGGCTFKESDRIQNLELPDMINFIGDHAFEGASLISSIKISSASFIGNQAFKGCGQLATVDIGFGTNTIGAECFSSTPITSIKLPNTIRNIGYGAFAYCDNLATLDLNEISQDCKIDAYAFYECPALTTVNMKDADIISIGDGAFACTGGAKLDFTFPKNMTSTDKKNSIGDFMFAGRTSLNSVVFPEKYGGTTTTAVELPDNMFHECVSLSYVKFPNEDREFDCGYISYDKDKLFADVANVEFYVQGPKMRTLTEIADPRRTTWSAVMAIEGNPIPYLYIEDGKEYYEVSNGEYLYCVDPAGIITSCTLNPDVKEDADRLAAIKKNGIDLKIVDKVGTRKIVGLKEGCFTDEDLNQNVKSLLISDDSLTTIGKGVFSGWKRLKKAKIGNSVKEIGDSAFEGCTSLIDVTFNSPSFSHEEFAMGKDAFKTGSTELTFHGDIAQGYDPFDWAMDPNNIIDADRKDSDGNPISEGIRVCYKSMAPTYITVMYNPITEMVTMLDYPKADQVETILAELYDVPDYNRYRENVLYEFYKDPRYDDKRRAFATRWNAIDPADKDAEKEAYASEDYGPWVNTDFVLEWDKWVEPGTPVTPPTPTPTPTPGGGDTSDGSAGMFDWLFEPLTVQAAPSSNPDAYYSREENKYNVLLSASERGQYRPSTPNEDYLLAAIENIVVPEGVQSIDVYGFVKDLNADGSEYTGIGDTQKKTNTGNVSRYFTDPSSNNKWDAETKKMYTINSIFASEGDESTKVESVAGLFSGYYKESKEENPRGNDTIRTVTMSSVKYLPDYAFDNCEQLQSVILGKDCADIGVAPFRGCKELRSVSNNDYYETDNGIIYSKGENGTYVIEECFASRGNPEIVGQAAVSVSNDAKLTSVSAIKPGAFEDCDVISSIDFSADNTAGLTKIPENCFKDCDVLNRVTLPSSVNSIEKGAFVGLGNFSGLLTIYGKEVKISGQAFDKDPDRKYVTPVRCYPDSAVERYVFEYGKDYSLDIYKPQLEGLWEVTYVGPDYKILEDLVDPVTKEKISNPQYVENGLRPKVPQDPVIDGWTFEKWVGMNGTEEGGQIYEDTVFFAQGYSNNGTVNGKYIVNYIDQIDGKTFATEYVSPGSDAPDLRAPVHEGFEFEKWNGELTNIQKNTNIVAMYKVAGGGASTSNGSTNTPSGGSTTTSSGGSTNTSSGSSTSTSNKSSSSSSSSSSTSSSSTTSAVAAVSMHRVTVVAGSGSGMYATGATVVIAANEPSTGMRFTQWTTESNGVELNQLTASSTIFTMPDNDVVVIANFEGGSGPASMPTPAVVPNANSNSSTGQTTPDNGNSRVDITKPGISNKDLATANVNGSTDNFIVKISETDEATRAVAAALTNKYGTLDNILYYAMDITLWDSTGTTQISDTTGLSVDITIPIPDSLVAYGGNNMAGAVVNGDQLESLNENFTTINGVPCIRFRATHFSPYTIYVDTGNLVEGMLDTTPKTGDPIHPKWFLSLGLACLSMILFLKRDKKKPVKVKKA